MRHRSHLAPRGEIGLRRAALILHDRHERVFCREDAMRGYSTEKLQANIVDKKFEERDGLIRAHEETMRMSKEDARGPDIEERSLLDRPELFAFMYQNYEPEYWWFECFDYIRRLMLTGILVVLKEGSAAQGLFGVLVALFGTQIYSWTRPFPEDAGDRLAETAQWSTFFTFLAALMILLNVEADSSFHREVFAVLLVAIQFMPLVIGPLSLFSTPKERRNPRQQLY